MSQLPDGGGVPEWDVADRMRKALRRSGITVQEMADYLDVTRGTVSTWINGHIEPSVQTLRVWAMKCGVDYEWLRGDRPPHRGLSFPSRPVGFRKPGRLALSPAAVAVAALWLAAWPW